VIFDHTQTKEDRVGSAENRAQVIGERTVSAHIPPLGIVQRPAKRSILVVLCVTIRQFDPRIESGERKTVN
jgi:hypothetical protein